MGVNKGCLQTFIFYSMGDTNVYKSSSWLHGGNGLCNHQCWNMMVVISLGNDYSMGEMNSCNKSNRFIGKNCNFYSMGDTNVNKLPNWLRCGNGLCNHQCWNLMVTISWIWVSDDTHTPRRKHPSLTGATTPVQQRWRHPWNVRAKRSAG